MKISGDRKWFVITRFLIKVVLSSLLYTIEA